MYCLDSSDKSVYLKASKDNEIDNFDHAWLKIIATECTEESRLPGDPTCASQTEITNYLDGKSLLMYNFNKIVNVPIQEDPDNEKETRFFR